MNTKFYISKKLHKLLFFIAIAGVFLSCQKTIGNLDAINTTTILPDLVTTTSSSASGFVTDENELPVKNATVQVGNFTTTTDKYGFFEAKNVQVVRTAAVVSITKTGYFKGIKTYTATTNKAAFFRIKLIPKTVAGTFNATAGGAVTMPSGLSINFPASAIVNTSTNAPYTGTVNVAAFYINPTAADINRIMPGDLRGLNTGGEIKLLTSFGMAAVELTGAAGEQLQIATGKKASLTMPVPSSLGASAPATIPLWSFDENNGLWKQEGVATKTGNTYVGDVSHFSFWNCDVPNNFVQFNCTVVNTVGQPVQNALVKISLVSNPLVAAYGYTDSSGYVQGAVPNNAQLKLEVFNSNNCLNSVFSQTFTTTNVNVAYGNVTINTITNLAILNGSVTNCSNNPVTNGYIIVQNGYVNTRYTLSNTGTYSINQILCGTGTNNITLIAEDIIGAQQSNAAVYPVSPGTNSIPTIQACGVSTTQYVNVTVNTVPNNYLAPVDTLRLISSGTATNYSISANRAPYNQATVTNFSFTGNNIAIGSVQNLTTFFASTIPSSSTINTPISVNITELGAGSGQYVAGNFAGVITGPSPTFTPYSITCNFRVQRF
jgi:hypothetical protein